MTKIAVLTDSTANLNPEQLQQYNIHVVPLSVVWGEEVLLDGVDITPDQFYDRLDKDPIIPSTSQPSRQAFLDVFRSLAKEHDAVVVLLISSSMSGTYANAQAAAEEINDLEIHLIDTAITGSGLAMAVIFAARSIQNGSRAPETKALIQNLCQKSSTYFTVDTLKYLHKGGRIGGAARFFGTAMSIKPILYLTPDGRIDALDRVRTRRKALNELEKLVIDAANDSSVCIGVMHSNCEDEARSFLNSVSGLVDCKEGFLFSLSPAIGTHTGPGTIGVCIMPA